MARPNIYTEEELYTILAKIELRYGFLSIETLKKAHDADPFEYPSYKMFERRMGGMRKLNTPDFRDKFQIYLDKLKVS